MKGKLFIVPTPVGNLSDMTFRAIEMLKAADRILCEDTRQSKKLCDHFQINTPLSPFHKMNEYKVLDHYIHELISGKMICLISDAGTPLISDPGNLLIDKCIENEIKIETLPGATAFVPALVNSGFDLSQFIFLGFPPHKKGRQTFIKNIANENKTIVIYESPYRIVKFLEEYKEWIGEERLLSISREISKKFEETIRGNASVLLEHFKKTPPKGEFVVVIASK